MTNVEMKEMEPKQIRKNYKEFILLCQKFFTGQIHRSTYSLHVSIRLDECRQEIEWYIDNPTANWPMELYDIVRRLKTNSIEFDLIEKLLAEQVYKTYEAIQNLREKHDKNKETLNDLKILEVGMVAQLGMRGIDYNYYIEKLKQTGRIKNESSTEIS